MDKIQGDGAACTYLVVGGQQRRGAGSKAEWHRHERGVAVCLNIKTGRELRRLEYVSPPEVCPEIDDPAVLFKSATLTNRHLYVPTQTEVLVYSFPEFGLVRYHSLPLFNDLHHVVPSHEGRLFVVVTGLDLVVEIDPEGEITREWSVGQGDLRDRFPSGCDFRRIPTTKPHAAHPNHVFIYRDEPWVTRFEQRDAVNLVRPDARIPILVERPHDGLVVGQRVYFTTVDGHVVIADLEQRKVTRVIDLNQLARTSEPLGWCRGLVPVGEDSIVVAFSRLRPTAIQRNIEWARRKVGRGGTTSSPTRLVQFNIATDSIEWEYDLEQHNINVVFSVHAIPSYRTSQTASATACR